MSISDVKVKAEAEDYERHRAQNRRAASIRLDPEVWARLDRLALELGWSRNRLVAELMDEASTDLAAVLSRDESGTLDADHFEYLLGDV